MCILSHFVFVDFIKNKPFESQTHKNLFKGSDVLYLKHYRELLRDGADEITGLDCVFNSKLYILLHFLTVYVAHFYSFYLFASIV